MAVVKHSDNFKPADLVKHNESLRKMAEMWKKFGSSQPDHVDTTVDDIKKNPGFYIKDSYRGSTQWRGPFESEQRAKDFHAEMSWERKHS